LVIIVIFREIDDGGDVDATVEDDDADDNIEDADVVVDATAER